MTASKIEWCDRSDWNPIRGCSRVSPGCGGPGPYGGCYAEGIAARFSKVGQPFHGFAKMIGGKPRWTGKVEIVENHLTLPLRWRKPAHIFACSMSDLFHEGLSDAAIDQVFAVMALCPHHTFMVLTKRPERMRHYIDGVIESGRWLPWTHPLFGGPIFDPLYAQWDVMLRSVWLGTSAEDQTRLDERLPHLLATPAAKRFLSCEPFLGPLDIPWACRSHWAKGEPALLHLVIVGGESGPRSRPCWTPDIRDVVRQCRRSNVPVFVKQLGANVRDRNDAGFDGCEEDSWPDMDPFDIEHDLDGTLDGYQGAPVRVHLKDRKGGNMDEWPMDLRVREMPT